MGRKTSFGNRHFTVPNSKETKHKHWTFSVNDALVMASEIFL